MALRRITSEEEKQKKRDRNIKIIVIALALILLGSYVGMFFFDSTGNSSTESKIEYNGVKFQRNSYGYWEFELYNQKFQTTYTPYDVENITLKTKKILGNYNGKVLYFSSEPIEKYPFSAVNEIGFNLASFVERSNPACMKNCELNYPIKSCANDTLVVFKEGNSSSIEDNGNCAVLNYASGEQTLVADAFLFKILGIK